MNEPSKDLRQAVLDAARKRPVADRKAAKSDALTKVRRPVAAAIVFFSAVASIHIGARTSDAVVGSFVALVVVAIIATSTLFRGRSMLGRPTNILVGASIAAPIAMWLVNVFAYGMHADLAAMPMQIHARCFATTAFYASILFAAIMYEKRESDPVHPRANGAAIGAACGAWGAAMIDLHCPATDIIHITLAHIFPIVTFAVLGFAMGERVLGMHAAPRSDAR